MEFFDIWNIKKTAGWDIEYMDDGEERSLDPGGPQKSKMSDEEMQQMAERILNGGPAIVVDPTTLHRCTVHDGAPETFMFDGDSPPSANDQYNHSSFSPHECSEKKGDSRACEFESLEDDDE